MLEIISRALERETRTEEDYHRIAEIIDMIYFRCIRCISFAVVDIS